MTDQFTFKDLSLDDVINKYRKCETTAGDDFFVDRLMDPFSECEDDFFAFAEYYEKSVQKNPDYIPKGLKSIGKFNYSDFRSNVEEMTKNTPKSNLFHYFVIAFVLLTFILIFIIPGPGFLSFLVAVAVALFSYFSYSKELAVRFYVYKYIIRLLKGAGISFKATEDNGNEKVQGLLAEIKEIRSVFASFLHGQYLIKVNESTNGNPLDVFLEYVRMIFHLDIIKYNNMHQILTEHKAEIYRLYQLIGMIDVAVLINKIRLNGEFCDIEYCDETLLDITDGYHPLIENPVLNSVNINKNMLITGCNASGKSTFLKMAAITVIFGEAFGFTFAKKCKCSRFNVFSSMAIKDNLDTGESYFTAELNSIKRILNKTEEKEPVLCIIDEILRGTNTVERIAASTEILRSLNQPNVICLAATHDIELTKLLSSSYINAHFSEEITESDVCFSYTIKEGPSDTRNAIRLLSIMGYSNDIVTCAEKRANEFINTGMWV